MTRRSHVRPGFDKRNDPRGNFGVHNSSWIYIVDNGECALQLIVNSGTGYPASVTHIPDEPPMGAWLSLHSPIALDDDSLINGKASPCDVLASGVCFGGPVGTTALGAAKFFEAHGVPTFEQPEKFWVELENWLAEWVADKVDPRRHLRRCEHCDGRGFVEEDESVALCDGSGGAWVADDDEHIIYRDPCPGCRACK